MLASPLLPPPPVGRGRGWGGGGARDIYRLKKAQIIPDGMYLL